MTAPCEPETSSWPVKALPALIVAVAGATWVILLAVTVRAKDQIPVSPWVSESEPVAL